MPRLENAEESAWGLLDKMTKRSKELYVRKLNALKQSIIRDGKERWYVHGSGLRGHYGQFNERSLYPSFSGIGGFDKETIEQEMLRRRDALHRAGKKMLMVEHFGQGNLCIELGADRAITSALTKYEQAHENVEQVVGDALSDEKEAEMYARILDAIKKENYSLQAVFFRPVGGLHLNSLNLYAFRTLYRQLRTAYELLDEDGLIFVTTTGANIDISLLQQILLSTNCDELIMPSTMADRIGIRKKTAVRSTLPSEEEFARAHPGIIKDLIALDKSDAGYY